MPRAQYPDDHIDTHTDAYIYTQTSCFHMLSRAAKPMARWFWKPESFNQQHVSHCRNSLYKPWWPDCNDLMQSLYTALTRSLGYVSYDPEEEMVGAGICCLPPTGRLLEALCVHPCMSYTAMPCVDPHYSYNKGLL